MRRKRINLTILLILIAMVFLILVNAVFGYLFVDHSRNTLIQVTTDRMRELSVTIANLIDGDLFVGVTKAEDMVSPEYDHVKEIMLTFMHTTEINFVYLIRYQAEGCQECPSTNTPSQGPSCSWLCRSRA